MKKFLSIILLCSLGISHDELKYTMDDFVGKWNLVNYIHEGEKLSIEEEKKNDYLHFKLDHTYTEIKKGGFNKGYWEYAPFGNIFLFYGPWKKFFFRPW
jgi:hypothetical protein